MITLSANRKGRIREAGLIVYGLGGEKTPEAFVGACDKFIYTELLQQAEAIAPTKCLRGDR